MSYDEQPDGNIHGDAPATPEPFGFVYQKQNFSGGLPTYRDWCFAKIKPTRLDCLDVQPVFATYSLDLANEKPDTRKVTLNGHQLLAALDFLNPDGEDDKEQRDSEIVISWCPARGEGEDFMPEGYRAWYDEYPEEGCIELPSTIAGEPNAD